MLISMEIAIEIKYTFSILAYFIQKTEQKYIKHMLPWK